MAYNPERETGIALGIAALELADVLAELVEEALTVTSPFDSDTLPSNVLSNAQIFLIPETILGRSFPSRTSV